LKSGSSTGASSASFFRPIPNDTVCAISSAARLIRRSVASRCGLRRTSSTVSPLVTSSIVRSVRIAQFPHAMSKPTPTTETWSRYAATPPMGIT